MGYFDSGRGYLDHLATDINAVKMMEPADQRTTYTVFQGFGQEKDLSDLSLFPGMLHSL